MKWGKTTTHTQQRLQSTVTSWQWQPNIFEEKTFARQKSTFWIKLDLENHIFAYMQVGSAKSRSARGASQPAFMGSCLSLPPRVCYVYLVGELVLVFYTPRSGWTKVKTVWLYNLKLEQAMRNLARMVISKSCLWWFDSYWGGLKLRKLVIIMYLLELFRLMEGGWWAVEMICTCLGGFLFVGRFSNAEKWSVHRKKDFFTNNFVDSPCVTVR